MRDSHVRHLLATWRELDDDTRAHVEEHLAKCTECRAEQQAFQEQDALLRNLSIVHPRYAWKQEVRESVRTKPRAGRLRVSHQAGLALALILVFLTMSVGTLAVSAASLPGDLLYPVKRTVEQVNLIAIRDRDRETAYLNELAERRREEARRVLELKRQVSLQFDGVLRQTNEGVWAIDGIPVQIDAGAMADAGIEPGDMVRIDGLAASGEMKVLRITERHQHGLPPASEDPMPAVSVTPTVEPSVPPADDDPIQESEDTPTPTATVTREVATDTPKPTKERTATRTPGQNDKPTRTPLPSLVAPGIRATLTATPGHTRTPGVGIAPTTSHTLTPRPTRTRPATQPGATITRTPRPTRTRPSTGPGATPAPDPTATATPGNTDPVATPVTSPSRTPIPPATPTRPPANDVATVTPVQPGIRLTPGNSPPPPPTATPVKPAEDTPPPVRETPTPPPSIRPGIGSTPTPKR